MTDSRDIGVENETHYGGDASTPFSKNFQSSRIVPSDRHRRLFMPLLRVHDDARLFVTFVEKRRPIHETVSDGQPIAHIADVDAIKRGIREFW